MNKEPWIFSQTFVSVYTMYINKAERKGFTKDQVDKIILWLTGYDQPALNKVLNDELNFKDFFNNAPQPNPNRKLIKGVVCGIRVENMEEGLMKEIRYLDKLIDELARGKKFENILRNNFK